MLSKGARLNLYKALLRIGLCRSSVALKGHGRFDHLIVLLLDKVPADWAGKYAARFG